MRKIVSLILIVALAMSLNSCSKDQMELDENKILKYLEDNGLTAEKTEDGLYYIIDEEGTGDRPTVNSQVKVHYEGKTVRGGIFDSSYDRGEPATFFLYQVIQGWQLGIPLFKEGGSGWLFIPSELAYADNPPPGTIIREDDVLIFKVELLEVL